MASGVLQGVLTDPALADRKPLWQYVKNLTIPIALVAMPLLPPTIHRQCMALYRQRNGGANQHERNELDILTRYFQYNAKDITENSDPR